MHFYMYLIHLSPYVHSHILCIVLSFVNVFTQRHVTDNALGCDADSALFILPAHLRIPWQEGTVTCEQRGFWGR